PAVACKLRRRATETVSLRELDAEQRQRVDGGLSLGTARDDFAAECADDRDQCAYELGAGIVILDAADEGAVQLNVVDWKRAQARDRARGESEIVQREAAAELAQPLHACDHARQVARGGDLLHLEDEPRADRLHPSMLFLEELPEDR